MASTLKEAFAEYFAGKGPTEAPARILIDDSSKLQFCKVDGEGEERAPFVSSASQLPLARPVVLAKVKNGPLYIGDLGTDSSWNVPPIPRGIWQVPAQAAGAPPVTTPVPVVLRSQAEWLDNPPLGMAVDDGVAHGLHVLLSNGALHRLDTPSFSRTALGVVPLTSVFGMVYDPKPTGGALIILDGGNRLKGPPKLILCTGVKAGSTVPFKIWPARPLTHVVTPLSLSIMPNGTLLVGDGGKKGTTAPADIWAIDRSPGTDPATWKELASPLIGNHVGHSPLSAPVAIEAEDAKHLLVLDGGLKPYYWSDLATPFIRDIVQPAALYRIELGQSHGGPVAQSVKRISKFSELIYPTDMVLDRGIVHVSDPGLTLKSEFRVTSDEFGVVVHFRANQTSAKERQKIAHDLMQLAEKYKPAHTLATLVSQI